MATTLTASCHCGAVRLSLPANAAGILACHCADCVKMHGNFNAFLAAPAADVLIEGNEELVWYQSSRISRRAFCGTCGARIMKEVTPAGRWLVSGGLIDGPSGKRLIKNLWEDSKPDWYELPPVTP
jgi:hypothetical protein